jgi:hypothetical protein
VVSDCVIAGNSAPWRFSSGGGAFGGTLNNCTLIGNSSYGELRAASGGAYLSILNNCTVTGNFSGGAGLCTLNNCTVTGNSGDLVGGADDCTLNNCIIYFNTGHWDANYTGSELNYCCTTPLPPDGIGNISADPLLVNRVDGNLRLQPNSPCINSGSNAYSTGSTDLDDNPRIAGGTVDIGAYEFQTPASLISYAWLQQYGLPTDGSVDITDSDGDGLNNWQEWRCGTNPIYAPSVLSLLPPVIGRNNVAVNWQSVAGITYFLERSTDLISPLAFTRLATNVPGQPGTTTYTDTNEVGSGPFFYRVGVSP